MYNYLRIIKIWDPDTQWNHISNDIQENLRPKPSDLRHWRLRDFSTLNIPRLWYSRKFWQELQKFIQVVTQFSTPSVLISTTARQCVSKNTYFKFHVLLSFLQLVSFIYWIHVLPTINSLLKLIGLISCNITSWSLPTLSLLWQLVSWLWRGLFSYSISWGRVLWIIICLLGFCYFNLRSGGGISCFCDIFLLCDRHLWLPNMAY